VDLCTHLVFPWQFLGRAFRNEDKVSTTAENQGLNVKETKQRKDTRDARIQRQPTAIPAHHFDNESTGVAVCGRVNVVDGFADTMESRGSANGHVRHAHIIVNGPHQSHDAEMGVGFPLFVGDFAYVGL
jgi:hypothetical protein